MSAIDSILSLIIKAAMTAIISVIAVAYVKMLRTAGWSLDNLKTNLIFWA
jgi:N-acyl-L-homoserine lactone synthetase